MSASGRDKNRNPKWGRFATKFLLSLLVISAGLTSATLLIVRYRLEKPVRETIRE